jgi:hypothetical protein
MIPEEEATGKTKDVYEEIKTPAWDRFRPQSLQSYGFQTKVSRGELEQG